MTLINTALSGALAAQIGLDTTSQNVANVMTPGYTRQGAVMESVQPQVSGGVQAGDGVRVPQLRRFSDAYTNLQMWNAASDLGAHTTSQPYLSQLEQVMGDDSTSINQGMDQFYAALNAASVDPTSSPLRQSVVTSAQALAQRFDSLQGVLTNQRNAVYRQRSDTVSQVNVLSSDIAKLNGQISASQSGGDSVSGLVDARDQKIDALASLVGVQVIDQADGTRTVTLPDGQPLVVGTRASTMSVQTQANGSQTLSVAFANEKFSLAGAKLGGQLGGLDDFETNNLLPMMQSITDMATNLASQVNTQLGAGFTMNGTAGQPLFVVDPSSASSLLTLSAGFTGNDLAFSSNATEPGDSGNLVALIGTKDQPVGITSLGNVLLGDAYTQLVAKLGTDSQQNQTALTTAQSVRDQSENDWKSTSGVNSDEEAMNLVQYQQMYQANMKVISVANTLFDSTLAMLN
jgi:flagellar hook-associated protein 1 FlgK